MVTKSKGFVFVLLFTCLLCLQSVFSSPPGSSVRSREVDNVEDGITAGIKVLYRTYEQCEEQEDMFSCLKLKALKFADRAIKVRSIPLIDGITLVKKEEDGGRQLNEPLSPVDETNLPADPEEKQDALNDYLVDRLSRFLRSFTLQFSVPKFVSDLEEGLKQNGPVEEGRGKLKKYGGALLLGMLMKGGMLAMAYKGIALLAGKALLVAKIALVLSAVIGLKKLVSSGGEEKVTYEIVKHPHVSHAHTYSHEHFGGGHYDASGGGGDHYRRSFEENGFYPHLLAYRGQNQQQLQQQQVNATPKPVAQ
ncbi:hypothetical protein C0J52_16945 [Blattella germanica]|nr:hypothetical protein C0J52_16945 [Blattella germanica]